MSETPTPGEVWRHRELGYSGQVASVAKEPFGDGRQVALWAGGFCLRVPMEEFTERFERLETPDDRA